MIQKIFYLIVCLVIVNSCNHCHIPDSADELIGTYRHREFEYANNYNTKDLIHIISDSVYVHLIFNDTIIYIDTSDCYYDNISGKLVLHKFRNVVQRTGIDYLGKETRAYKVCLPYIEIGDKHYDYKKISDDIIIPD